MRRWGRDTDLGEMSQCPLSRITHIVNKNLSFVQAHSVQLKKLICWGDSSGRPPVFVISFIHSGWRNRASSSHSVTHKHWHTRWCTGRCWASPLMPLLPSGPAASWHLSPWRRLIASPDLARGERRTEREEPSLHPFICLLQWWPSPSFYCPQQPPLSLLRCLLCPHHCRTPFIKKP